MQVKVIIKGSPYSAVAAGAIGEVVEKKYSSTKIEQWKVLFSNGTIWTFYPDELEVIDATTDERTVSAGAHR